MRTLLRDVITIPERAGEEDYVLRLTDNIGTGAHDALDNYVVTDDLAESFDQALGLVAEAITNDISRGAFLAGSFGSGKSHFMAVLHAILRQDPTARGKAELQSVIARHDPVLQDKNVLPLAFHLLGSKSLEQALFDGYIRQIQELHPGAPLPALHRSDQLLADAENLRTRIGDEQFFAQLSGDDADDEWGAVLGSGTWDRETYDRARATTQDNEQRQKLVSALVEKFFTAYTQQAEHVDLDTGLAAMATHAKSLGYDAVVLFLDELVLWLAFSVRDQAFFRRESQKLTKLVESATGRRAIPLISFVARQMDLRRWFADSGASGAEQEALDRAFRHQEGRFGKITLGDDNLPYVARRRLLRRKDEQAEKILDDAFNHLDRRPEVWDVLLDGANTSDEHRGADETAFRRTYPFSPALVSTLRSLASVMQRERTALKVMQQMLVDRRETLTVEDVIPVGDAFSYVVSGQAPLDQTAAALFRSARTLYQEKLRPMLLQTHGLSKDDLQQAEAGTRSLPPAYLADDRLAQTLLLAAVAPKVPALKDLTASRLASLNHGSIKSPLPGNERNVVLSKVKDWSRTIPDIHVGEDRDPVIRVQLEDVDYESVVDNAKGEDNPGRRRELVKGLLAEKLGVTLGAPDMLGAHTDQVIWRGSKRDVDLVFGNVRDSSWLTEDHFANRPGTWRIVIDHPFDEEGHTSEEDRARVDRLIAAGRGQQTLVWLPHFLSDEKMRDLRRLVILDWLLEGTGERWTTHADHLSEVDRASAKAILQAHRHTLRESLGRALEQAYGILQPAAGVLLDEDAADQVLISLDRSFDPGPARSTSFAGTYRALVDRAYESTYPGHPRFEPEDSEVRPADLRAVHSHLVRAMEDPERRVPLEGTGVAVRRVANALGVGHAAETHFIFGDDRFSPWGNELARAIGQAGLDDKPVRVSDLRRWIDAVTPARGLRPEVSDLVVLGWALLRQRTWYQHGAPIEAPEPGKIRPEMELRPHPMPSSTDWGLASKVVKETFGRTPPAHLTPHGVAALGRDIRDQAQAWQGPAQDLVNELQRAYSELDLAEGAQARTTDRLRTAEQALALVTDLKGLDGVEMVRRLAAAAEDRRASARGTSLARAEELAGELRNFRWTRLGPLRASQDQAAVSILSRLTQGLTDDEAVTRGSQLLRQTEDSVFDWLADREPVTPTPPPPGPATDPDDVPVDPGTASITQDWSGRVDHTSRAGLLGQLSTFLDAHDGEQVEVRWRVIE